MSAGATLLLIGLGLGSINFCLCLMNLVFARFVSSGSISIFCQAAAIFSGATGTFIVLDAIRIFTKGGA